MKKNKLTMILIIAMVAVVSIGATLALSSAVTEVKTNNFMVKNPYSFIAEIYEPAFEDDPIQKDNAMRMAPGSVINKDPFIRNESTDDTSGWAGMRVVITVNGSIATASQIAIINSVFEATWDTTNWIADAGTTPGVFNSDGIYYYDTIIKPMAIAPTECSTTPIFDKVSVKDTATKDQLRDAALLGNIDIKLVGCTLDEQYGATLDSTVMDFLKQELNNVNVL